MKADKIKCSEPVEIELCDDWVLQVDNRKDKRPSYVIVHGKKSMAFDSSVMNDLCNRRYSIRLVNGRRQMSIPWQVLDSLAGHGAALTLFDEEIDSIDQGV